MKDLIQAQEKEFEYLHLARKHTEVGNEYPAFNGRYTHDEDVLNWHKSSTKALLEAVIEEIWEMKREVGRAERFARDPVIYLQALTDLQDKLKEEMSKI